MTNPKGHRGAQKHRDVLRSALQMIQREALGRVDHDEFASQLLLLFGGPSGLAQEVFATYKAAASGSVAKQRLLGQVFECVAKARPADVDFSKMSDEELEEMAEVLRVPVDDEDGDAPAHQPEAPAP